jgi:predicted outer membrane repeat protein
MVWRFALLCSLALLAALFSGAPAPVSANGNTPQLETWVARGDVANDNVNGETAGTSCSLPDYIAGPDNADVQIQLGVDHTLDEGILHLCAGTYNISSTILVGSLNVTLQGAGATITILDGGNTFNEGVSNLDGTQILTGNADLIVSGLTFLGGHATANGGAIDVPLHDVTVIGSQFIGNSAYNEGGAIRSVDATITSSTFEGNACGGGGGAVNAIGEITVDSSEFTSNAGLESPGGALFSAIGITVANSIFTNNNAANYGGAIFASDTAVTDSAFTGNGATEGGAIYSNATSVANSTFSTNNASSYGGAIYSVTDVAVTASTFTDNTAITGGDDVYALEGGTVCGDVQGEGGVLGTWSDACAGDTSGGGGGSSSYNLFVTTPRFGTITTTDGFSCAPTDLRCTLVAVQGSTVLFSSSVLPGYALIRWNGCTSASASTCSVTLNADTTISASYGSRWLARFVGAGTTLRVSAAATVRTSAKALKSAGTGDTITITGYAKTAGAKALERAKVLRRALRAAGVTAPITITTAASSATPAKRAKAAITVVWGVTP